MPIEIDILSTYLPMDRAHALARGETLPNRAQGTELFADVSGFTVLTEALARHFGPRRGAEELTRHLNQVYDALVNEIHRHNGSVINFSGDALTCWFDTKDGDAPFRAVACALAMQKVIENLSQVPLSPSDQPTSLTMKVAVANGPPRRFVVGDPAIQLLDVMAGTTLARMAVAEHLGQAGEVIADRSTITAIEGSVEVADWRVDEVTGERFTVITGLRKAIRHAHHQRVTPALLTEGQLRPWLLNSIHDRLCAGQGEFLTELRLAVALFLRFEGIDYDGDEAAGEKLSAFICHVQTVLVKYEGVL